MVFFVKLFGRKPSLRSLGRDARKELLQLINENDKIIIDFEDVDLITNSFADEFIGVTVKELGLDVFKKKTTFRNIKPFVAIFIIKAINNRSKN